MTFQTFFNAYVECALWASVDDDGESLDVHDVSDIAPETLATMRQECADFHAAHGSILVDDAQAGHDFWLTRNRHGAGFWDRGLGDIGKQLTDAARAYGSADLYLGDDGLIYQA